MNNVLFSLFIAVLMVGSVLAIGPVGPIIGGTSGQGFAVEVNEQDWAREASLNYDGVNDNFGLSIVSHSPTIPKIGETVTIKAKVTNQKTSSGSMYVQCSILDATEETWLRTMEISRSASVGATSNCVANEPHTKTYRVDLKGSELFELSFKIPAPAFGANAQPRIFCDTFERCASQGDPFGSGQDVKVITIAAGAECVSGQSRCVSGSTTKTQKCVDGKWSTITTCPSGQLCRTSNGECFVQACNNQCEIGKNRCVTATSYNKCVKNSEGCNIWGGTLYKTDVGYSCNNGLISTLESCAKDSIRCISNTTYQQCQLAEGMAYAWYPTVKTVASGKTCQNNQIVELSSAGALPGSGLPGADELMCFKCVGDKPQQEIISASTARMAAIKDMSLWDRFISFIRGSSRAESTTALCENVDGYYTDYDFVCKAGHVKTNPKYFDPEIYSFKVFDCSKTYKDLNSADLTCFNEGQTVEWELKFKNNAKWDGRSTQVSRSDNADLDMSRQLEFDKKKTEAYAKKFGTGWYTNFEKWLEDHTLTIPVAGTAVEGALSFRESVNRWIKNYQGIDYDAVKSAYNAEALKTTPVSMPIVEVAFRSEAAGKKYYGYQSELARQGDSYLTGTQQYQYAPGCKMSGGQNEDSYGYLKSSKVLFVPEIEGKCNVVGTRVKFGDDAVFAACDYTIYGTVEVPNSGDKIGAEGLDNVDPNGKYYLQAQVFDECYEPGITIISTDADTNSRLVQTGGSGGSSSICCAIPNQAPIYTTLTECASKGGQAVSDAQCSSVSKTIACYDCGPNGVISKVFSSTEGTPECNSEEWNSESYRFDSKESAIKSCLGDAPEETHTCWECLTDGDAMEIILPISTPCKQNSPNECGGQVNYKKCYPKCGVPQIPNDYQAVQQYLPCPSNYPLSEEEWIEQDKCAPKPSVGSAFINPSDDSKYCIQYPLLSKAESCEIASYDRKEPIEIGSLSELKEAGFWDKMFAALTSPGTSMSDLSIIKDPEVPVCLDRFGDVQCSEGSICLQAEKGKDGSDSNLIYDAILNNVNLDPTPWNGALQIISSATKVTLAFVIGADVEESFVEQFGMCVHEDRDVISSLQRWFAETFGLDMEGKYFNYYFYGAIAAIVIILFLVLSPRQPRPNQGGGF